MIRARTIRIKMIQARMIREKLIRDQISRLQMFRPMEQPEMMLRLPVREMQDRKIQQWRPETAVPVCMRNWCFWVLQWVVQEFIWRKKRKTDKAAENLRNAQKRQWREKSRCCFFDGLGVLPGNFKLMWFNKVNGNNYCKKKIECDPFFTWQIQRIRANISMEKIYF